MEQIEFKEKTTLKSIFLPLSETEQNGQTEVGQLVFLRSNLDFSSKAKNPGEKKDEVLEENLLDVKRLLKTSKYNQQNKEGESTTQASRKGLVNLVGVEPYYTKKD